MYLGQFIEDAIFSECLGVYHRKVQNMVPSYFKCVAIIERQVCMYEPIVCVCLIFVSFVPFQQKNQGHA